MRPDGYAKHLTTVEVDQWFWSLFPSGITLPARCALPQTAIRHPSC